MFRFPGAEFRLVGFLGQKPRKGRLLGPKFQSGLGEGLPKIGVP